MLNLHGCGEKKDITTNSFSLFQWHIKEVEKVSAVLEGKSLFSVFEKIYLLNRRIKWMNAKNVISNTKNP